LDFEQRFGAKHPPQTCWLKSKRPENPLPVQTLLWPFELQRSQGFKRGKCQVEITLEINPIQITPQYVEGLKSTPVNRLSIGLQSCRDEALKYLGRRHTAASIPDRIKLLRQNGYRNISLDLIYGLPEMSLDDLRQDLDAYLALDPEHISCYLLSLDEDGPLGLLTREGKSPALPDDESCAAQYELICSTLKAAGFQHYEISNFARPGYEGLHNLSYWKSLPYLALGASAAGWLPPHRYQNPASLDGYQSQIDSGILMPDAESLSPAQEEADYLMMGLRLLEGLDLHDFEERFGHPLSEGRLPAVKHLQKIGMIEIDEKRLKLSDRALFVSNAVIAELL